MRFAAGDVTDVGEASRTVEVGNRSGAVRSVGSPSMRVIMPRRVRVGNQHRLKIVLPGGACASDTWRTGSPPQRKSSFDVCGAKGVSLCLLQRRRKIVLAREVLYTPDSRRKSRKRFKPSMAFRAAPKMTDNFMIQILGSVGRNQFVAAPDAIYSEQGGSNAIEFHNLFSGQSVEPVRWSMEDL